MAFDYMASKVHVLNCGAMQREAHALYSVGASLPKFGRIRIASLSTKKGRKRIWCDFK